MTARKRKPDESFKQYRKNLKNEETAYKHRQVKVIWGFSFRNTGKGTMRNQIPKRVRRKAARLSRKIRVTALKNAS